VVPIGLCAAEEASEKTTLQGGNMTTFTRRSTRTSLATTVALGALASMTFTGFATAQVADPAKAEVVIVTGSRIATASNRAISPVRVITAESIRDTGEVNIDEILKTQNQFLPSNGATTSPLSLESHGASTLDMRGLGQNRTLVLVNGQRATPNGFRNSADVNAIPSAMIARVETLTGGAAAVYGADAVSGVTNFILRDRYEGFEVTATGNISGEGDGESYGLGITYGKSFFDDRLNIVGHAGYVERGEILRIDRSWSTPEVNDAGANVPATNIPAFTSGGSFQRFATATATAPTAAPIFAYDPSGALLTSGVAAPLLDTFSKFEAFQNPNDRTNFALFATFEVAPWAKFYTRATHAIVNNTSQQLPIRTTGNPAAQDILVQRTNPFVTSALTNAIVGAGGFNLNAAGTAAGTDAVRLRVSKTLLEFGPLTDQTERTTTQIVVGLKGDITPHIKYDLAFVSGSNVEEVYRWGWGSLQRYRQATNVISVGGQAACADATNGCVPFNIFGPSAGSAAAVAFINGDRSEIFNKRVRHQDVANLAVSGDTTGLFSLPAGPIGWAVGVERREEDGNSAFGPRAAVRDTLHFQGARGQGPLFNEPLKADFELTEVYAEMLVPVLEDVPFFKSLDLEGAYRWSDHSRSGRYETWKLGLNWAVNDTLRFRGSQQSVVRGPNIGEFFTGGTEEVLAGGARPIDYCSEPSRYNVPQAFCSASGAPAPGYIQTVGGAAPLIDGAIRVFGGDLNIKPESGETFTYGFVLTPQSIPGLSVLVDYYEIQLDDAIGSISATQLMDSCYLVLQDANSNICRKITRDPTTGRITRFDTRDANLTLLKTAGTDITISYSAKIPEGLLGDRVSIMFNGGRVNTFQRQLFPSDNLFDCAGKFGGGVCTDAGTGIRAIPSFRSSLNVGWTSGPLTLRGTWRYSGEVDALLGRNPPPGWIGTWVPNTNSVQHIDSWDYFDLGATYVVSDRLRISGTVNNVFDKLPPILGSAQSDANTLPNQYDIVGRRFGINILWKL
jgi:iron complex outermembrane recepter protein